MRIHLANAAFAVAGGLVGAARAKTVATSRAEICSCIDANGQRITSDRPITGCVNQLVLHPDGTVESAVQPTDAERAAAMAKLRGDRKARVMEAAPQQDLTRRC